MSLTDVGGLLVGHHHADRPPWLTGTTVVVAPEGAVAGVDVRGGGPGTRETEALDPSNLVGRAHAVVLTGGSAYGLDAAGGVTAFLEERGLGLAVGEVPGQVVPIVPAAVLFDLGRGGDWRARPDAGFGYRAAEAAMAGARGSGAEGSVGAGTGAVAGSLRGGIGSAGALLPGGAVVAAMVAVNSRGEVVDPGSGLPWALHLCLAGDVPALVPASEADLRRAADRRRASRRGGPDGGGGAGGRRPPSPGTATTIGVVATDAAIAPPEARRLAVVAHDGLARAIRPVHGLFDGDTLFALATCRRDLAPAAAGAASPPAPAGPHAVQTAWSAARPVALEELYQAGADCVARAVVRALLAARSAAGVPCYRDAYPSVFAEAGEG